MSFQIGSHVENRYNKCNNKDLNKILLTIFEL